MSKLYFAKAINQLFGLAGGCQVAGWLPQREAKKRERRGRAARRYVEIIVISHNSPRWLCYRAAGAGGWRGRRSENKKKVCARRLFGRWSAFTSGLAGGDDGGEVAASVPADKLEPADGYAIARQERAAAGGCAIRAAGAGGSPKRARYPRA